MTSVAQHARPTRYGAQHARPVSRGLNTPMRGCLGLNTPVRRGTGAQRARPVSRGLNTPMRGCLGLNTPVRRGTGGSTGPSGVPRAQHAHAGVSGSQHDRPTRYRGLNTPVRLVSPLGPDCLAKSTPPAYIGSTRPCGGVGGSTRPSYEVPGAQHARPVSRRLNTPMRVCRGLNTPSDWSGR
ncbi:hypothetical protein J6590_085465 [Homalodisca vitripennis]|nr:hypothetical protein J6590_085465 [Homalodisca vitripennis]